jgi:hypothetical protein
MPQVRRTGTGGLLRHQAASRSRAETYPRRDCVPQRSHQCRIPMRFLWLTLLASSSASSTYVQYVSGASSSPPRYPLKAKWYHPTFCGQDYLDIQDRVSYSSTMNEQYLIKLLTKCVKEGQIFDHREVTC